MSYDDETLEAVFAKTTGTCRYYGKRLSLSNYGAQGRRGAWVVDHANLVSRGGTDYMRNLWPACIACNLEKGDRTAQSYLRTSESRPTPTGDCLIATAAFGTPWAPEIESLRWFRDHVLVGRRVGTAAVWLYSATSPEPARWITNHSGLALIIRPPLRVLSRVVRKMIGDSDQTPPNKFIAPGTVRGK
jgi:hypothetical protein